MDLVPKEATRNNGFWYLPHRKPLPTEAACQLHCCLSSHDKNTHSQAGEMAWGLRALAALSEDLAVVPGTRMAAHTFL